MQWPPWISSMFWFFLWSNISRKQTRQYRKSTTTTSIIPVRYGAVNKWRHESIMDINKIYHSFGQHCLSCRRPRDLIFNRLLSKSAGLRGSVPDPAGALQRPQTPPPPMEKGWSWQPCWKIVPAPLPSSRFECWSACRDYLPRLKSIPLLSQASHGLVVDWHDCHHE